MADYTVIRSRRKTVALHVRDGYAEVRAPLGMGDSAIEQFVASKAAWLEKHLHTSAERAAGRAEFCLNYGDFVTVRGRRYPLSADACGTAHFDGAGIHLPPGLTPEQIKRAVIGVYRQLANTHIKSRVHHYAALCGLRPTAIKINAAKTRWGSCSGKNSLNLSWRLVMAEDAVIDYVIVHELMHIKEHNHSPRFWANVAQVLPDYRQRQAELKKLQAVLATENWE